MSKKIIFKYDLPLQILDENDALSVSMPRGAKVLHVAEQTGRLVLHVFLLKGGTP